MSNLPDSGRENEGVREAGRELGSPPRTPRWVKWFGIVTVVVLLLFVVLHLTGFHGGHGPARHTSSGDHASHTDHGGQQP